LLPPEVVNGEDVRMRERGDGLRLPLEPREGCGVRGERLGQDLDRDVAIQLRVARSVDLAHAACTKQRDDFVRAEASAGGDGHVVAGVRGLCPGWAVSGQ
jgi:hypothetical protein